MGRAFLQGWKWLGDLAVQWCGRAFADAELAAIAPQFGFNIVDLAIFVLFSSAIAENIARAWPNN